MTAGIESKSGIRWGIAGPALALIVLVAAYTVYWFSVTDEIRKQVEAFATQPQQRLVAGWDEFSMRGYPYRIEAAFTQPAASAPDAPEAWEWRSERASVALLPYNLRHAVLTLGREHLVRYREPLRGGFSQNEIRATVGKAQASYVELKDMPFGRLAIDVNELDAQHFRGASGASDRANLARLQLHTRPSVNDRDELIPAAYDFALRAEGVTLESDRRVPVLGNDMSYLLVQARLRDVPGTRHLSAIELLNAWRDTGGTLSISDLIVKWGPLDLTASGKLSLDAQNRPEGRLDARVTDFKNLVDAMAQEGIVKEDEARIALAGLVLVSQFQGNRSGDVLVPVIMDKGRIYLGPLAIGNLTPLY